MINPGTRPSRLTLARHATGETSVDVSDVSSREFLAALEAERARVEPFDFELIRARAARLEDAPVAGRLPTPLPWWRRLALVAPLLAMAAAAVLVLRPGPANRDKGADADLGFYVLRDGQVYPGDPDATFRAGDRIQFTYRSPRDHLVLLSVDGDGVLTVFYPEAGERGVPVVPGDRHVLEDSILLDDAPGPEVFLGFFGDGWGVARARAAALDAWERGGEAALLGLAEDDPDIAALPLDRAAAPEPR
jgi:hypothetical protein